MIDIWHVTDTRSDGSSTYGPTPGQVVGLHPLTVDWYSNQLWLTLNKYIDRYISRESTVNFTPLSQGNPGECMACRGCMEMLMLQPSHSLTVFSQPPSSAEINNNPAIGILTRNSDKGPVLITT